MLPSVYTFAHICTKLVSINVTVKLTLRKALSLEHEALIIVNPKEVWHLVKFTTTKVKRNRTFLGKAEESTLKREIKVQQWNVLVSY